METTIINEVQAPPLATIKKNGLAIAFITCYISILFSGITSMLMPVHLTTVVTDLLGTSKGDTFNNVSAFINSAFVFGSMFGGFAWGFVCDSAGRSKSVALCTACYGLFTLLTAFSGSWLMIGIYRFLTGFGVGGVIVTTNILIAEIWPEKKRAVALGIVSAAMPVGFIAAGAMNYILPGWHNAFLTGLVPLALSFTSFVILPESQSWKLNRQASAVSNNQAHRSIFAGSYRKNLLTGSLIFGAMLIGLWAIFLWAPTFVISIAGPGANPDALGGQTMMLLAVTGLIGSMIAGLVTNAIGLRKTMMMCFAACFIMTFIVFRLNTSVTNNLFIEMGVLAFFFGISQGALSVYIPQLFPTIIRASATGFCFNIGRLFTATVVFFIGALVSFLGGYGKAVFTFSFIFLIGLVITFFSKDEKVNDNIPAEQLN